jgi:hypothetical protein
MNPSRLVFAIVAGCCLLHSAPLSAQQTVPPPPYVMDKQYSSDLMITTKNNMTIPSKTFVDGDKIRNDISMNGMAMTLIVRKDQQKIYQVLDAQKMVMEMAYDPAKFQERTGASLGPEGKFDLIGPDTVDGVACTEYKVTSEKGKVFNFWLDATRKVPVEMKAADSSFVVKWTNFKVGPQDPALFEVPKGYQVMNMPGAPASPGASAGAP